MRSLRKRPSASVTFSSRQRSFWESRNSRTWRSRAVAWGDAGVFWSGPAGAGGWKARTAMKRIGRADRVLACMSFRLTPEGRPEAKCSRPTGSFPNIRERGDEVKPRRGPGKREPWPCWGKKERDCPPMETVPLGSLELLVDRRLSLGDGVLNVLD